MRLECGAARRAVDNPDKPPVGTFPVLLGGPFCCAHRRKVGTDDQHRSDDHDQVDKNEQADRGGCCSFLIALIRRFFDQPQRS